MTDVAVLTANQAALAQGMLVVHCTPTPEMIATCASLVAAAKGRTTCIPVQTEAELREMFEAWFRLTYPDIALDWDGDWIPDMFMGWLALARHLGAIKP